MRAVSLQAEVQFIVSCIRFSERRLRSHNKKNIIIKKQYCYPLTGQLAKLKVQVDFFGYRKEVDDRARHLFEAIQVSYPKKKKEGKFPASLSGMGQK